MQQGPGVINKCLLYLCICLLVIYGVVYKLLFLKKCDAKPRDTKYSYCVHYTAETRRYISPVYTRKFRRTIL
jgi:hypothetical protein